MGEKRGRTPNLKKPLLLPQLLDARWWQLKFFKEPLAHFAYKMNI
jgi:hypothetical protein